MADEPVVCVLAGAGTGKTRVLTLRVVRRLQDRSAHPDHVLVSTFSRKAADELRDRLWALGVGGDVLAGTFHRTALRLIRQHRADHGQPPPAVLADRRELLGAVVEEQGGRRGSGRATRGSGWAARGSGGSVRGSGGSVRGSGGSVRGSGGSQSSRLARLDAEIGWAKARLVRPDDYATAADHAGRRPAMGVARVAEIYDAYETARRRRGALDLDDLVGHCADLLEADDAFARAVRWRHRQLFVDETQDLNEAQYRLLRLLAGDEPDLFVVGDPDQSVYGWNGADPGLLARIPDELAGTRVVRLDANHRCSPQVVRVAAAALGSPAHVAASTREDGTVPRVVRLATDADEATWVARQVWLAHRPGRCWSSIAVLARTNAQLVPVAGALSAARVPHRIAGRDLGPASDIGRDGDEAEWQGRGRGDGRDVGRGDSRDVDQGRGRDGDEAEWQGRGRDDDRDDYAGDPEDAVVLATFHKAKGLQWPAVFVIGLSDGLVPLVTARRRAARDEERRLLYVALTRAEDELNCSWAGAQDDEAVLAGAAPRAPSPWLAGVEQALEELTAAADNDPDTARVAEHMARIRAQLVAVEEGPQPAAAHEAAPSP